MAMWLNAGFILGGYLVGAIPHLYLLGRLKGLHLKGDLHMALWRQGGRLFGTIGFLLELFKGFIVIIIGRTLGVNTGVLIAGGVAAVVGQMWPVFYHFDGEKGNSIGAAMALTLTPGPFGIAAIFMATGYLIRTVPRFLARGQSLNEKLKLGGPPSLSFPLGMAIGFAVLPLAAWGLGEPKEYVIGYAALFGLIMIRRLTAGLTLDLEAHKKLIPVVINRLLYDRPDV
jgi:acyl phosphate:glycerol-3-phosphate acyltransferase